MNLTAMNSTLSDWATRWRNYRSAKAGLRELENDPRLTASVAADLGLTIPALKEVVAKGAGAYDLMARMMAAFDLDPAALRETEPEQMREFELTCSLCAVKGRCKREIDAGTAAANARSFCPNAAAFQAFA